MTGPSQNLRPTTSAAYSRGSENTETVFEGDCVRGGIAAESLDRGRAGSGSVGHNEDPDNIRPDVGVGRASCITCGDGPPEALSPVDHPLDHPRLKSLGLRQDDGNATPAFVTPLVGVGVRTRGEIRSSRALGAGLAVAVPGAPSEIARQGNRTATPTVFGEKQR